ncbi:MAG: FecR domain-containing protein [Thermodesulfobacteria bacterium]|nr:FecR domain-containing protein [Thermodesulfobacteriota bacterium]
MKKSFFIFTITLILMLITQAFAFVKVGVVKKVLGRANVLRQGKFPAVRLKPGDPVFKGDILRTKSRSKLEIQLIDGSVIKIGPRSRVDITQYIKQAGKYKAIFELRRGTMGAFVSEKEVKEIQSNPKANKFEVHTPIAIAGVRGTDFVVSQLGELSSITVLKGKVYVFNKNFPQKIVELKSNQFTIVKPFIPPLPPKPVLPSQKKKLEKVITISKEEVSIEKLGKEAAEKVGETNIKKLESKTFSLFSNEFTNLENISYQLTKKPTVNFLKTGISMTAQSFEEALSQITKIPITETSNVAESISQEIEETIPHFTGIAFNIFPKLSSAYALRTLLALPTLPSFNSSLQTTVFTDIPSEVTLTIGNVTYTDQEPVTEHSFEFEFPQTITTLNATLAIKGKEDTNSTSFPLNVSISYTNGTLIDGINQLSLSTQSVVLGINTSAVPLEVKENTGSFLIAVNQTVSTGSFIKSAGIAVNGSSAYIFFDSNSSDSIADKFVAVTPDVLLKGENIAYSINATLLGSYLIQNRTPVDVYNRIFSSYSSSYNFWQNSTNTVLAKPWNFILAEKNQAVLMLSFNSTLSESGAVFGETGATDYVFGGRIFGIKSPSGNIFYKANATLIVMENFSNNTVGFYFAKLGKEFNSSYIDQDLQILEAEGEWKKIPLIGFSLNEIFLAAFNSSVISSTDGVFVYDSSYSFSLKTDSNNNQIGIFNFQEGGYNETAVTSPWEELWQLDSNIALTNGQILNATYYLFGDAWGNQTISEGTLLNSIHGKIYGAYLDVNSTSYPVAGIFVGETLGTFDPNTFTFQRFSSGVAISAKLLISLIDQGKVDELKDLGIPVVEIGRDTLEFKDTACPGGICSVTMQDVRFLSTSANTPPTIWVTDKVSGTYAGTVLPNTSVVLSSNAISNLNFKITHWDTSRNAWAAEITSGTGSVGGYIIEDMRGYAGGKIDPSNQQFTGEAAGIVKSR